MTGVVGVEAAVPLSPEKRLLFMTVLSVADLFAGANLRIHEGCSVSELF